MDLRSLIGPGAWEHYRPDAETRFVVVAHPKHDRELWEPVHPGHIGSADVLKLHGVLLNQRITHEVWTHEQWDDYDSAIREELFDEDGNEREEA